MSDSAMAMRAYTAAEIDPLLKQQMTDTFLPQSVPFYAATQNFLALHAAHPQYGYKEATLNPTNLRDRASDWEADIIQRFRNDASAQQIVGERTTPMGPSLYLAKPIRAESGCLVCHGQGECGAHHGSRTLWREQRLWLAGKRGRGCAGHLRPVGRSAGECLTRMAEFDAARRHRICPPMADRQLALYWILVRPLRSIAQTAEQLSRGQGAQSRFAPGGGRELAMLAHAFERMRISLEKAMRLLEK